MRQLDLDRLQVPYPGDPAAPGPGPNQALGLALANWQTLTDAVVADCVEGPPYGIGWWSPNTGTSRRILIADQLIACLQSVTANLVEARLHWFEFQDFAERESDRMANAVVVENGQLTIRAPRRESPWDDLTLPLSRLHQAGLARALAGGLDCVAGTIIGITGLPVNLLKADFSGVRAALKKQLERLPLPEGEYAQAMFGLDMEATIAAVGPAGWLEWLMALRNMVVHRGRRIEIGQFVPRLPVLYGADGQPVPRTRVVNHLPRDPQRSDVEVFLDPGMSSVLTEDAGQTLGGLLDSTQALIEALGERLLRFWNWRKEQPARVVQSARQWRDGVSTETVRFAGYVPGAHEVDPTLFMTNPAVVSRLRAAALDDANRPQWAGFD